MPRDYVEHDLRIRVNQRGMCCCGWKSKVKCAVVGVVETVHRVRKTARHYVEDKLAERKLLAVAVGARPAVADIKLENRQSVLRCCDEDTAETTGTENTGVVALQYKHSQGLLDVMN